MVNVLTVYFLWFQNRVEGNSRTAPPSVTSHGPNQPPSGGGFVQRNPRNTQGRAPPRDRPYRNSEDNSELGMCRVCYWNHQKTLVVERRCFFFFFLGFPYMNYETGIEMCVWEIPALDFLWWDKIKNTNEYSSLFKSLGIRNSYKYSRYILSHLTICTESNIEGCIYVG